MFSEDTAARCPCGGQRGGFSQVLGDLAGVVSTTAEMGRVMRENRAMLNTGYVDTP